MNPDDEPDLPPDPEFDKLPTTAPAPGALDPVMVKQFPHPVDSMPLGFGKYRGKAPLAVAMFDPGYIVWCHGKGIATGTSALVEHCQRVVERAGPAQPRGHLKYGRRR